MIVKAKNYLDLVNVFRGEFIIAKEGLFFTYNLDSKIFCWKHIPNMLMTLLVEVIMIFLLRVNCIFGSLSFIFLFFRFILVPYV